ncbi:hypothetical protein ASD81_10170 [Nocardioides sp. Root614]|nr:hypothetical protein ASD81_10170 [Nocardioides sp. Root614]KRA92884.1 hypothetical protein ASD84_10435 [Nocardioides sp. Root682]
MLPILAAQRQVIVADLPGHGRSPMPQAPVVPDPAGYAHEVAGLLDALGIDQVDVAGNSIGGWTALELALVGRARSVVALSPAGLWAGGQPRMREAVFLGQHFGARLANPIIPRLARSARGRRLLLGEAMTSAASLEPDEAAGLARDFATTERLPTHIRTRRSQRFLGGRDLTIPVTVAWAAADRLIPRSARLRDELPAHTTWLELAGCGHVPMWDDPGLVAETILTGTDRHTSRAPEKQ